MVAQETLLIILVKLVDSIPMSPPPTKRPRGHPKVYADGLFLKALVIMLIRQVHSVSGVVFWRSWPNRRICLVSIETTMRV